MNKLSISRGDIWYVNLDPVVGREQAKKRPCLVVSPTTFNQGAAELAVIVPITSKYKTFPWFVPLEPHDSGLPAKSYIISNQVRTVSLARFSGLCIGTAPVRVLIQVEQRLRILLGI